MQSSYSLSSLKKLSSLNENIEKYLFSSRSNLSSMDINSEKDFEYKKFSDLLLVPW